MEPLRILAFSFYYPPFLAARFASFTRHWYNMGHDVHVVSHTPADATHVEYASTLPSERVHRVGRFLDGFLYRNAGVTTGRAPLAGAPQPRMKIKSTLIDWLAYPDAHVWWIAPAFARGLHLARECRPDVVFVTGPPFSAVLAAAAVARAVGVPWVADYRDPWGFNPYDRRPRIPQVIDGRLEKLAVRTAAALVTVSAPSAETLRKRHPGINVSAVLTGFDPSDFSDLPPGPELNMDKLHIVCTGNLYGGTRDPSCLLSAIRHDDVLSQSVALHFIGPDSWIAVERAAGAGVQVESVPTLAFKEALAWQKAADVLLLLMPARVEDIGTMPYKVFDYIGAKRPILAIGRSDNAALRLVTEHELGLATLEEESIRRRLRDWLTEKRAKGSLSVAGNRLEELTREHTAIEILAVLQRAFAAQRHRDRHTGSIPRGSGSDGNREG